jgi:hypothetical protein
VPLVTWVFVGGDYGDPADEPQDDDQDHAIAPVVPHLILPSLTDELANHLGCRAVEGLLQRRELA